LQRRGQKQSVRAVVSDHSVQHGSAGSAQLDARVVRHNELSEGSNIDNRNLKPSDPWLDNAFAEMGLVDGIDYDPDPLTNEDYAAIAASLSPDE
jgi:hypothetical protein